MLAIPVKKRHRLLALVLGLIFVIYLGYVYSLIRAADEHVLVVVALGAEPVQRIAAKHELLRRVRASESTGVEALSTSLSLSSSDTINADTAISLANELLELGVDINGRTDMGSTPLHMAINLKQPDVVTFLLENCADPGVPMSFGPKEEASHMNALEMAYLMEREFPDMNYSGVIEVLERSDLGLGCGTQR